MKIMNMWPWFAFAIALILASPQAEAADRSAAIKITHMPVTWAVKGQPLTLKARVTGGVGKVSQVTLYYALFKDAAPFRVTMAPSGLDMYVGTIEAGLLTGISSLSYYIEAQDREGTLEETPWYDVTFRSPDSSPAPRAATVAPTAGRGATASFPGESEGISGRNMALIAGGVAAVAVGAYLIADSGGGGGSSSSDLGEKPGTYFGSSTLCSVIGEDPATCSTYPIQILIDSTGRVFSDTLFGGQQLVGNLTGNDFTLTANINEPDNNLSGSIVFSGTVLNENRIVGSIAGSGTQAGSPVTYSGTFTANK